MNPILRNVLAVVAGLIVGAFVNMGIIMASSSLIPPPDGVDVSSVESISASMHLYQPKHYILPFLAHALGTLVGAILAVKLAVSHHMKLAMLIGAFFLFGGITKVIQLPAPLWFEALDLIGAYLPMGWLAFRIVNPSKS